MEDITISENEEFDKLVQSISIAAKINAGLRGGNMIDIVQALANVTGSLIAEEGMNEERANELIDHMADLTKKVREMTAAAMQSSQSVKH